LFIQVRERLGLCYFIRAGSDSYEDTGSFAIQAGLDLKKLDKALTAIGKELRDVKLNGVSDAELARAKAYLKGKMALSLEDSSDMASFLGKQVMFKKSVKTSDEIFALVDAIAAKDIHQLARNVFDAKKMHITTLSPFRDISRFAKCMDF